MILNNEQKRFRTYSVSKMAETKVAIISSPITELFITYVENTAPC